MRIAISFRSGRLAGGIEAYLDRVAPVLRDAGYQVAFLFEHDEPAAYSAIDKSRDAPRIYVGAVGRHRALARLREWRPDIVFNHGIESLKLEEDLLAGFPAIYYAHGYRGACISGQKAFAAPIARPCHSPFGAMCLVHYFPHRCGGLSPKTMLSLYAAETRRLKLLRRYRFVITNSEYVRREYLRLGLDPDRVRSLHPFIRPDDRIEYAENPAVRRDGSFRLLFAGRMVSMKGVDLLLDALPIASGMLGRPIDLMLAGDGPRRRSLEARASQIERHHAGLRVTFPGWIAGAALADLMSHSDLMVMPGWWPEPFGLVGLEAGLSRLPVAAFAVGGIPEWLSDGINGYLASGEPPTARGLAEAIAKCLRDPAELARLRSGALAAARSYTMAAHLRPLIEILARALGDSESQISAQLRRELA
jgi:glycosyltransferase involved in cell wall biosynthesis